MKKYIMGIDVGTSGIKVIIIDQTGKIIENVNENYDVLNTKNGYCEQDPEVWIEGFDKCLKKIIAKNNSIMGQIEGISCSGQMHSLVVLDENHKIIRNAILWNDTRTTDICAKINMEYKEKLFDITGNIALEGFTLPKLIWIKNNESSNFKKIYKFCMPKDYLIYRLTGVLQTELSDASGTLLLDINYKNWSKDVCAFFGIPETILPSLNRSEHCVGNINKYYQKIYKFNQFAKVYSGCADNAAASLACGIIDENTVGLSIGTSGVIMKISNTKNRLPEAYHTFIHAINDRTYSLGVTLSAAYCLKWFKQQFEVREDYYQIMKKIGEIEEGGGGVFFTPWMFGERTPYLNSKLRANFLGIGPKTSKWHLARSVVEGITYSLKVLFSEMTRNYCDLKLISTGGGSKSNTWLQIQANILNITIETQENNEGPAAGVAIIVAKELGWFKSYSDCQNVFIKTNSVIKPEKDKVEVYKKSYEKYIKIYSLIKEFYDY